MLELVGPGLQLIMPSVGYILLRVGFAAALLHPESTLALQLYDKGIAPFLQKHQKEIDENIKKAVEKGK